MIFRVFFCVLTFCITQLTWAAGSGHYEIDDPNLKVQYDPKDGNMCVGYTNPQGKTVIDVRAIAATAGLPDAEVRCSRFWSNLAFISVRRHGVDNNIFEAQVPGEYQDQNVDAVIDRTGRIVKPFAAKLHVDSFDSNTKMDGKNAWAQGAQATSLVVGKLSHCDFFNCHFDMSRLDVATADASTIESWEFKRPNFDWLKQFNYDSRHFLDKGDSAFRMGLFAFFVAFLILTPACAAHAHYKADRKKEPISWAEALRLGVLRGLLGALIAGALVALALFILAGIVMLFFFGAMAGTAITSSSPTKENY